MTGDRLIRADTAAVVTAAARGHRGRRCWLLRVRMHVLEREAAEREQLGALLNGESS
jgi:hypothetical protein